MAFPLNPVDGQIYTTTSGIQYAYTEAEDRWDLRGAEAPLGETGLQGSTGLQGANGETGLGYSGTNGDTGPQGLTGLQGFTGLQGITGLRGSDGDTGVGGESFGATGAIMVSMNGGGTILSSGYVLDIDMPFSYTFDKYRITAHETGAIFINILRSDFDTYPPTVALAETGPFLDLEIKKEVTDLSGWVSSTGSYGDVLRFNIGSVTGIQNATLSLYYHRDS